MKRTNTKTLSDFDKQILCIQKSTKTLFRVFGPIHDKLRMKFAWYYKWHMQPIAHVMHWSILGLATAAMCSLVVSATYSISVTETYAAGTLHTWPTDSPFSDFTRTSTEVVSNKLTLAKAGSYVFANKSYTEATMSDPSGVTVDPATGNVYVTDYGSSTNYAFAANETKLWAVGGPYGKSIAYKDGKLYIANVMSSAVLVLDATNGDYLGWSGKDANGTIGWHADYNSTGDIHFWQTVSGTEPGAFGNVERLTIANNRLYVKEESRISIFTISGNSLVPDVSTPTIVSNGACTLTSSSNGITADSTGNVFLLSGGYLQKFNSAGVCQSSVTDANIGLGMSLAADSSNRIHVGTNGALGGITGYDNDMTLLGTTVDVGAGDGQLSQAGGLVWYDNKLFVAEGGCCGTPSNKRVEAFTFDPTTTAYVATGSANFTYSPTGAQVHWDTATPTVTLNGGTSSILYSLTGDLGSYVAFASLPSPRNSVSLYIKVQLTAAAGLLAAPTVDSLAINYSPVVASTCTWDGGGADNSWSTAANWSGDVVPTSVCDVVFDATSAKASTVDSGFAGSIKSLSINTGYTNTLSAATTLVVDGDVVLAAGTLKANSNTISVGGNWNNIAGTFVKDASTVQLVGTSSLIVESRGQDFYRIVVDAGSGSYAFSSALTTTSDFSTITGTVSTNAKAFAVGNDLIVTGGTLTNSGVTTVTNDVNISGTATISSATGTFIVNSFIQSGGTFTAPTGSFTVHNDFQRSGTSVYAHSSGTIIFDGDALIEGNNTFYNFTHNTGGKTVTVAASSTQTIAGTLSLNGTDAANRVTLVSSAVGTIWNIVPQGTILVSWVEVSDSTSSIAIGAANSVEGAARNTINWLQTACTWTGAGANDNWSTAANWSNSTIPTSSCAVTFDDTSTDPSIVDGGFTNSISSLTIDTGYTNVVTLNTSLSMGGDLILAAGILKANGNTISVGGKWNNTGGTFTKDTSTVRFVGTAVNTIEPRGQNFYLMIFDASTGSYTFTSAVVTTLNLSIASGIVSTNTKALTVGGDLIMTGGTLTNSGATTVTNDINMSVTATISAAAGSLVTNKFIQSGGTFTAPTGNFTIHDDFQRSSTSVYTHSFGTIIFDGDALIEGDNTFYNFTHNTSGKTITVTAGTVQTVAGLLTINGADATNRVTIVSTSSNNNWKINPLATTSVSWISVANSISMSQIGALNSIEGVTGTTLNWLDLSKCTWTGLGASRNWSDAANWSNRAIPSAACEVIFTTPPSDQSTVDGGFTNHIKSLSVSGNYTGSITMANDLNVDGDFSLATGVFVAANYTLNIGGSWSVLAGTFQKDTSTVRFVGLGARTMKPDDANQGFYNMKVAQSLLDGDDTMSSTSINGTFWNSTKNLLPLNGALRMYQFGNDSVAMLASRYKLTGDFDVQVSYSNLLFSGNTGSGITLQAIGLDSPMDIVRKNQGGLNLAVTNLGSAVALVDNSAAGVLRIRRTGSVGYVYGTDGTTIYQTGQVGTNDVSIQVNGLVYDTGSNVQADFSNYVTTTGTTIGSYTMTENANISNELTLESGLFATSSKEIITPSIKQTGGKVDAGASLITTKTIVLSSGTFVAPIRPGKILMKAFSAAQNLGDYNVGSYLVQDLAANNSEIEVNADLAYSLTFVGKPILSNLVVSKSAASAVSSIYLDMDNNNIEHDFTIKNDSSTSLTIEKIATTVAGNFLMPIGGTGTIELRRWGFDLSSGMTLKGNFTIDNPYANFGIYLKFNGPATGTQRVKVASKEVSSSRWQVGSSSSATGKVFLDSDLYIKRDSSSTFTLDDGTFDANGFRFGVTNIEQNAGTFIGGTGRVTTQNLLVDAGTFIMPALGSLPTDPDALDGSLIFQEIISTQPLTSDCEINIDSAATMTSSPFGKIVFMVNDDRQFKISMPKVDNILFARDLASTDLRTYKLDGKIEADNIRFKNTSNGDMSLEKLNIVAKNIIFPSTGTNSGKVLVGTRTALATIEVLNLIENLEDAGDVDDKKSIINSGTVSVGANPANNILKIKGSTAFDKFSSLVAGKEIQFESSKGQKFSDFTVLGSTNQPVVLTSTTTTSAWPALNPASSCPVEQPVVARLPMKYCKGATIGSCVPKSLTDNHWFLWVTGNSSVQYASISSSYNITKSQLEAKDSLDNCPDANINWKFTKSQGTLSYNNIMTRSLTLLSTWTSQFTDKIKLIFR